MEVYSIYDFIRIVKIDLHDSFLCPKFSCLYKSINLDLNNFKGRTSS